MSELQLIHRAIRDFFDETPVEEWTYILFLESFKHVILSELDISKRDAKATWRKRFLKRLETIADDDAYTEQQRKKAIILIEKDPRNTDFFWDNIEKEKECLRRKREVKNKTDLACNNTEIEAIEILEVARTEKKKVILNSLKRKYENTFPQQTEEKEQLPEIEEQNETGNDEDTIVCDGSDDSDYIPSDIEDPSPPLIPSQLKDFHECFANMSKAHKWFLASGKCVENTIFEHCKELTNESLLHSWIIDLDDQEAKELFTTEEWNEIRHEVQLPKVNETFVKSMMRFSNIKTTRELREVLAISFLKKDDPYSREDHFDAEWAEIVMRKFLTYYEDPNDPLKRTHLESWYDINLWSQIVDHGLSDIFGMEVVSEAVSARKNRKRARMRYRKVPRKKIGYKMDGIFRTYINNIEYGAIEVAKKYEQTKLLGDGFKLSKAMHDIFVCLCQRVDNRETIVRKLRIPGMLHLGLKSQVLQMSSPKGYVTILKRDKLLEVPNTVGEIRNLIKVLASVWKMKKLITDTMKIVLTPQESYEFYRELVGQKYPTDEIDVPCSLDSIV
ncbi:32845_t:CDS:10 [Gigaspora margarita]|uniref:32845_t:CDS:1 n=1 Tax=Gigaspora margarita TaxID=4874 RepID=A0ABM8W1S9_GIGMA|nr:32845_t:CDS:10 [Gigaspora margarita]